MNERIFLFLLFLLSGQKIFASYDDFPRLTQPCLYPTTNKLPLNLSDVPVGPLNLEADMSTLREFIQMSIDRQTKANIKEISQNLGTHLYELTRSIPAQIKPFFLETPPKKTVDSIKKMDHMQTCMTDFFIYFNNLLFLVFSDESEKRFGIINTEAHAYTHLMFQDVTRAYLRFSNAYCSFLEKNDPNLFKNSYGIIPEKRDRQAIGYLKENENFLLFPVPDRSDYLFLIRHNYSVDRNFLTSGTLFRDQHIIEKTGLILLYDKDLKRKGLSTPWQVTLYSGSNSPNRRPFSLSHQHMILTKDFFNKSISPVCLNSNINAQVIKSLFLEDALNVSEDETQKVVSFFEFPQSEMDNNLVDLLLLEDLIEGTQSPSDADPTLSNTQTSLLLTHMCSFYKKEPEDILKEKEEALVEKIAQEIRQSYTPTTTTTTSLENTDEQKTTKKDKKKTRGTPNKRGGNSRHAKSTTPTTTHKKIPSEESILREARNKLKALKIEGRLKWGAVLKRVNQVCSDLPTLSDNTAVSITGSHIVVHTPKSSPITLVKPHKGRDAIFPDTARSFFMDLIMTGLKQNGS